jgi:small neutral amino acid transporter SnatA (MarC family)
VSQFLELFLTFLVILNPLGALLVWNTLRSQLVAPALWAGALPALVALALLAAAILLGDSLLEVLDLSHSSFQVAAGLLLLLGTARIFVQIDPFSAPRLYTNRESDGGEKADGTWRYSFLIAVARMTFWLATPAALAAMAFYGADRGEGDALWALAATVPILIGSLVFSEFAESSLGRTPLREGGRVTGVMLVVVAVDLILDGIVDV